MRAESAQRNYVSGIVAVSGGVQKDRQEQGQQRTGRDEFEAGFEGESKQRQAGARVALISTRSTRQPE